MSCQMYYMNIEGKMRSPMCKLKFVMSRLWICYLFLGYGLVYK